MKIHKTKLWLLLASSVLVIIGIGSTVAFFGDQASILGSSFSVGSADIKFLTDLAGGTNVENLTDQLSGPVFASVSPNWTENYYLKIFNNATGNVQLTSNSNYETANDPDDLRQIIYVEPFEWDDLNNNGLLDEGELGASFGKKTIIKWKTEGYDLGTVSTGSIKGLLLKFSTASIPDSKQGKTAIFDFIFNSVGM